ncbi:MAG TPA: helix-turn-helix transcriptional regulator [Rhizomicrobium sp.]|jgi:DNA-binding CsgD family transcriptional regulator|nr:helix-turn-helix transcriptional regulator [Rhizomicrobium sp.]
MFDRELASRILDHLELEIIAVDAAAEIVFCSEPARRLLSANKAVFSHRGNLFFRDGGNTRWFQSVLSALSQGRACECTTLIPDDCPGESRFVSIHLIGGALGEAQQFLVTFSRCGGVRPDGRIRTMMQHFGLTPAELRLTLFLSTGRHLTDAATAFRVSRHTVRNQLRSIFEKVGVRRQTELTRLMWAGPQTWALT